jgi:molecular chaperone DnaK
MKDAESHSADDEAKKAEIEARNRLDGLVYNVEKTFNESKDKLGDSEKSEIETALSDAKTALKDGDTDAMNSTFETLQTASHKLAEVLYSQQSAPEGETTEEQASSATAGGGGDDSTTAGSDDDVIDAEYVDAEEEPVDDEADKDNS